MPYCLLPIYNDDGTQSPTDVRVEVVINPEGGVWVGNIFLGFVAKAKPRELSYAEIAMKKADEALHRQNSYEMAQALGRGGGQGFG